MRSRSIYLLTQIECDYSSLINKVNPGQDINTFFFSHSSHRKRWGPFVVVDRYLLSNNILIEGLMKEYVLIWRNNKWS